MSRSEFVGAVLFALAAIAVVGLLSWLVSPSLTLMDIPFRPDRLK